MTRPAIKGMSRNKLIKIFNGYDCSLLTDFYPTQTQREQCQLIFLLYACEEASRPTTAKTTPTTTIAAIITATATTNAGRECAYTVGLDINHEW
eukprot:m.189695 g.189695  ORF g.189695 m.189695 type:complete len:94 (-) comp15632_c0_seq6:1235-1516(-)